MLGLGSQSELGIGIAIQMQDQFSGTADRVLGRMNTLKSQTNALINQTAIAYRNQAALISAGAIAVSAGFWGMAKATSEFGHRINQVDIIGEGALGKTKKQLAAMSQMMGAQFATAPGVVAGALFENAKQGITKGMEMITKYELAVSKATDENLNTVSDNLLHVMNAFNMTAIQMPRIANAITAAANATTASVSSLGEGMQYAAFQAHQFGIPLEQTLALVSKLQQSGIQASSSGTALQNMFTYLGITTSSMATKKQKEMWNKLGLDRGQMGDLMNQGKIFEVLGALDKQLSGIAPNERAGILKSLVNVRGTRAVLGTWGSGDPTKSLEGIYQSIKKGVDTDVAMRQSKAMMNDPYGQFLKLQVAWDNAKINFMTSAGPMIMTLLKAATGVINMIGAVASTPVGPIFAAIVGIGAPLVAILYGLRAASLGLAIAFKGVAGALGPGFSQILRAELGTFQGMSGTNIGNAGMPFGTRMTNRPGYEMQSPGYLERVSRAANGFWRVRSGQEMNLGNKVYTGGKLLPKSFNPALGGWYDNPALIQNAGGAWSVRAGYQYGKYKAGQVIPRSLHPEAVPGLSIMGLATGSRKAMMSPIPGMMASEASMAGNIGKVASTTGKFLPMLGGIASTALDFLPIIGQIALGITIIAGIVEWFKGDKQKENEKMQNPAFAAFKRQMDKSLFEYDHPYADISKYGVGEMLKGRKSNGETNIQQHIHVYTDGQKVAEHVLDQKLEDIQNLVKINLSH